ncbi:MAG: HDOD domain-containing protein [Gemmatimonadaceae bacterium]|nr:HDOD domain-containing protein [Gemmatimonadaceae bacterium]
MTTLLVRSAISRLKGLGTIPTAAMRLLSIADDPAVTEDRLNEAIELDPTLSARVLKVVNSAFYRRQREIASTREATRLLGLAAVRNIAIASGLHRLFRGNRSVLGFDAVELWSHALGVAALSRELAVATRRVAPEEALLAGLLHDLGIIAEAQLWPAEFAHVIQRMTEGAVTTFRDAERDALGMSHDETGALLCEAWNLPERFVHVCRYHHDVGPAVAEGLVLPLIVHVADVLAARAGLGFLTTAETAAPDPAALAALGLSEADLTRILEVAQESADVLAATLAD